MTKRMIAHTLVGIFLTGNMAWAAIQQEKVMTKQTDGTYIVNTTTICSTKGYNGTTPLSVYIKKGKIVKIEALKNQETPKYFGLVKKSLFPKYINMEASKVAKAKVDGVTGATYSSTAVKENVKAAAKYYKTHK